MLVPKGGGRNSPLRKWGEPHTQNQPIAVSNQSSPVVMKLTAKALKHYGSSIGPIKYPTSQKTWLGKKKVSWNTIIGQTTDLIILLTPNGRYQILDPEKAEPMKILPDFSLKDKYTIGRIRNTFHHLKDDTNSRDASECEYIEHKPTGAFDSEPVGPPQVEDLANVDFWKYAPSPSELETKKYTGIRDIFKDYGMRPIKIKENDLKYIKNAGELEIPFIADIPDPELKLLENIYKSDIERLELRRKTNFKPFFKVIRKDGEVKLKIDKINAGKIHPAYSKAQAKIHAKRKTAKLVSIGKEIFRKGLISIRDGTAKLFWKEEELFEKYINGEITEEEFKETVTKIHKELTEKGITHQSKLYAISLTLTLPKEISEEYMRLQTTDDEEFRRLEKALDTAREKTLYKIALIQLQRDGLFTEKETNAFREIKKMLTIIATGQKHITNSAFYGREITPLEETDYRNDNDPFSPHVHYHDILLNAVKITAPEPILERLGVEKEEITYRIGKNEIQRTYYRPFYRISPHINVELAKRIWRDEVIRELTKAGFKELAKEVKKYEKFNIRARYTEIMKIEDKRVKINIEFLTGATEYAKRRPTEDIAKYFMFEDDWKKILEKYPEKWIRAVLEYPNKTYNYGILKNPKRYGLRGEEDEKAKEQIEEYYDKDKDAEILKEGIPAEAVINWLSKRYDKVIVKTKVGNRDEYWLYVKEKPKRRRRPTRRRPQGKGRPTKRRPT